MNNIIKSGLLIAFAVFFATTSCYSMYFGSDIKKFRITKAKGWNKEKAIAACEKLIERHGPLHFIFNGPLTKSEFFELIAIPGIIHLSLEPSAARAVFDYLPKAIPAFFATGSYAAKLMSQEFKFVFVKDVIGTDWISIIPWPLLQNFAESFTKLTLSTVLLILGTIFIIVGALKRF